jgi:hypothetical protein
MRKKVTIFLAVLVLVLSVFVSIVSFSDDLDAINKGHWLYDEKGEHKGCESPGKDCTWSVLPPTY